MEILAEAVKLFIGNKQILKGIDFELHNKEFVGIIGPNGSGKSSFLKCVYRIQKPDEGKIFFDGRSLDELSYRETALKLAEAKSLVKVGINDFIEAGFISSNQLVKVLGNGTLTNKLEVEAHAFSKTATAAIEAAGGTVVKL